MSLGRQCWPGLARSGRDAGARVQLSAPSFMPGLPLGMQPVGRAAVQRLELANAFHCSPRNR